MDVLRRCLIIVALIPLALVLAGCQAGYLLKSAYSQADLLLRRVPIDEALRDPAVSAEHKRKLLLATEARLFAESALGLAKTKNYSSFVQLERPYVTYVVNASLKTQLTPHLWNYPLVGALPYKGFFDPDGAQKEAQSLERKGLDVHVRGVTAFSTLGWFKDPILSSMLNYEDHDLVNTIIHETVHATIYIKSEAQFNERLATFIGNKGTEAFYLKREGAQSATLEVMRNDSHDEHVFGEFISAELKSLEAWYDQRKGLEIIADEREKRLAEIGERFSRIVRPHLKRKEAYAGFESAKLNNARLLNYRLYFEDLSEFESVFESYGRDFQRMLAFCKSLEKATDPQAALSAAAKQASRLAPTTPPTPQPFSPPTSP